MTYVLFLSAPGEGENERAGSTEPPVLEKDAPFRQVLKSIRDYHGFPTPPETVPHPDRSSMARSLGLNLDHAPALHLPASQLTKALLEDTNTHMRKFEEDQTQGAFLPIPDAGLDVSTAPPSPSSLHRTRFHQVWPR